MESNSKFTVNAQCQWPVGTAHGSACRVPGPGSGLDEEFGFCVLVLRTLVYNTQKHTKYPRLHVFSRPATVLYCELRAIGEHQPPHATRQSGL